MSNKTSRDPICLRTITARTSAGLTPTECADRMKIDYQTYIKYETRSGMPQHRIAPFCKITGSDPLWLLTGEGEIEKSNQVPGWLKPYLPEIKALRKLDPTAFKHTMESVIALVELKKNKPTPRNHYEQENNT